ncbi:PLP-dependent transferase [Jonesiaceae bacterium BS-20]|uniref:homocysteine desulfhydrase n=1 Tax=Jonesiaceae bacterium BS-20 TaxID=3120821 RepID=A0AAU7DST6_9MICO
MTAETNNVTSNSQVSPQTPILGGAGSQNSASSPVLAPATIAVSSGRPPRFEGQPVNPPVVLSSTYFSTGPVSPDRPLYTRMGTETWDPFERAVADLEGAALPGVVFGSGMAAIAAVLALVPAHGKVVLPRHSYQVTLGMAHDLSERYGVEVALVDVADTAQCAAAFAGATLVLLESPTNPMLEVGDLPALIAAAHAAGALVAVDNTFATPLVQRPLLSGADVVIHSATKYLAGHSDVVLGIAVTNDQHLLDTIRGYRTMHGAIAGPFEVWLALRGLRTLALRVERAGANALELAKRLQTHPKVKEVRFPGLDSDPGFEVASRTMAGFGAIIGLIPQGGQSAADALVDLVNLWLPATSLGGVESTLERRRRFGTESQTVPVDLIRMSVGIEDVEDLWADLDQALAHL